MAITEQAKSVIERPLDKNRVKQRAGGQGMTFDYIGTEHAIQLLNEAFDYAWDTTIKSHEIFDGLAVALVELKVWDDSGSPIVKQQFGSCNINRGVDTGAALKGAASDGLKKCASQLGVALELYLDDVPAGFKPPSPAPGPAKRPSGPPQKAAAPAAPPARPAPAAAPPKPPTAAPAPAAAPPARPAPPTAAPAATRPNPFTGSGNATTASVPKPSAPVAAKPAPPAAPPAAAAAQRPNPFGGKESGKGITTVQMSALSSLASKKGVSQTDLVALAEVVDEQGAPKQTFEELTHAEAIEVVKAAQR
jgi:hypothetical protein